MIVLKELFPGLRENAGREGAEMATPLREPNDGWPPGVPAGGASAPAVHARRRSSG